MSKIMLLLYIYVVYIYFLIRYFYLRMSIFFRNFAHFLVFITYCGAEKQYTLGFDHHPA